MLSVALIVAPIFIIIVLGRCLAEINFPADGFWPVVDKLVFWLLVPALLFHKISLATFDAAVLSDFGVVILGGFAGALAFGLIAPFLFGFSAPLASSVMQGSCRHNTFIALAVVERLFGAPGLELAILISAILIPVTNLAVISSMSVYHSNARGGALARHLARDLGSNPILISIVLGALSNILIGGEIPALHSAVALLGSAALPMMLLSIGAGLRKPSARADWPAVGVSAVGKFAVFPVLVLILADQMGLGPMETTIAVVYSAVPAASGAYSTARMMGGDAPMMATIISVQTILGLIALPLYLGSLAG